MSSIIAEYSTTNFNSLYDFSDVLPKFDSIDGDNLARVTMMELFRRHEVEHLVGLALLHKHGELQEGERLTDVRGTSHPLSFSMGVPSVWGINSSSSADSGQLVPVEFSIEENNIDWQAQNLKNFILEFSKVLTALGATKIFGLCAYPGDGYPGRVEFTVGRSNVNLTPDEAKFMPSSGMREAAWFYTDDFRRRGCRCNCLNGKDHTHSHGYTT